MRRKMQIFVPEKQPRKTASHPGVTIHLGWRKRSTHAGIGETMLRPGALVAATRKVCLRPIVAKGTDTSPNPTASKRGRAATLNDSS
jgi:hypothetical protein